MITAVIIATASAISLFVTFLIVYLIHKKKSNDIFLIPEYNIKVYGSKHTAYLTPDLIKQWVDSVVLFWSENTDWSLTEIKESLSDISIIMIDSDKIEYQKSKKDGQQTVVYASALAWPFLKIIKIAIFTKNTTMIDESRIESLFRHELSHFPVELIGNITNQEEAHRLFKDKGLEA